MTRTGLGFDAHKFGGSGPTMLCGVAVDTARGLEGTSDGDVALHAIADALLGAASLGDLGVHFPSDDPAWHGADSLGLLAQVARMLAAAGWNVVNVDVTIVAQSIRVSPHRESMCANVASALNLLDSRISVKATTTDGMGFIGRDEGVAVLAVATVEAHE